MEQKENGRNIFEIFTKFLFNSNLKRQLKLKFGPKDNLINNP